MSAFSVARIEQVARAQGVSFYEAARRCGKKGARRRRVAAEKLTAVQKTWAWKKDFE